MPYSDIVRRLFNVNLFGGTKLGLQNVQFLQKFLEYPDRSFQSIHVAGTNGKGSVSTKIAKAFELAGYRVGLYTSPHISSFRERIRINGEMISEAATEDLLLFLFKIVDQEHLPATFFELTTFLAFLYFTQEKVDIAVLETGLGGRLDATNIVHPCLSIITSIGLDHTEILGSTKEAIALEKGGIIKEKVPVVIGPRVPFTQIQEIAIQKQSLCMQVESSSSFFEEENRSIAQSALNFLAPQFNLSDIVIQKGLEGKQPCRFEVIKGPPIIILDVAHNPDGFQSLFQAIKHHYPSDSLRLLFGLSKNKDLRGCLRLVSTAGTHFHLVEASNGRGVSTDILYSCLQELSVERSRLFRHETIFKGVRQARQEALKHGEILVICGSFFIMSQVRQALGYDEPCDAIDLNERYLTHLTQNEQNEEARDFEKSINSKSTAIFY
jgi:dihydrofolate synthase / folylpolyglutamate synthase